MSALWAVLLVSAVFLPTLVGLPFLAARVRRSGAGGGLLGPFEEMWHPAAVRSRLEVEVAEYRPAEGLAPGDRLWPLTTPAR